MSLLLSGFKEITFRMCKMYCRTLEDMSTMSDGEFACFLHLVLPTLLEVSMVKQTLSETDVRPVSYSFQCHSYYRQNKTRVSFPAFSHGPNCSDPTVKISALISASKF